MDAESTIECTCELCRPNWYLGRDDSFVVTPPQHPTSEDLEVRHALKVRQAGLQFDLHAQEA